MITEFQKKYQKKKIDTYASTSGLCYEVQKVPPILIVLEHVYDLYSAIKRINILLKKGGYTFHHIDLKDHYHTSDKCYLNFLTTLLKGTAFSHKSK